MADMEMVSFWIPRAVKEEVRRRASADGRSMGNYMRMLLAGMVGDGSGGGDVGAQVADNMALSMGRKVMSVGDVGLESDEE
jgi:hypothetical protein